ncbi:cytochrome c oxidase subunit 1 [Allomyces javanicus]|nr:cytochrome c oxidase subunit 1 [Allomyces javanicus]
MKRRGCELDEIFAYNTFKTVKVRDRRLGLLHYTLILGIMGYIVATIIVKQLYLSTEEVTGGSVRTTILPPANLSTPDYCRTNADKAPCVFLTAGQVMPQQEEAAMFITTRLTATNASAVPDSCIVPPGTPPGLTLDPACLPQFPKAGAALYYAAAVEDYTIMVEHTVRGYKTDISSRNGDLKGIMMNSRGTPIRAYAPSNISRDEQQAIARELKGAPVVVRPANIAGDIFTVRDVLNAAGITSLDAPSVSPSAYPGETLRHSGVVVIVMIEYANELFHPRVIRYNYRISTMTGAEAKQVSMIQVPGNGTSPILQQWSRHGIRIKFVQTGKVGEFELIAVLTSLVASLALFRLAVMLVEIIMIYILPERDTYRSYKYDITEDFSILRSTHDHTHHRHHHSVLTPPMRAASAPTLSAPSALAARSVLIPKPASVATGSMSVSETSPPSSVLGAEPCLGSAVGMVGSAVGSRSRPSTLVNASTPAGSPLTKGVEMGDRVHPGS